MKKLDAHRAYLILTGVSSLLFTVVFTFGSVYRITVAHMDPLQLVLAGTALEATIFVFEIPTGIVADVYSRRTSILIGLTIIGLAFVAQGLLPWFVTILIAEALWGLGYTFTSGAQEAWIADEVGPQRAEAAYLRGAQMGQIGSLLGIGVSTALAGLHIQLPIVLGGVLFLVLTAFLALSMPEQGFKPAPRPRHGAWQAVTHTASVAWHLIRRRPVFSIILIIGGVYGMASEAFDRLWEAHFLGNLRFPTLGQLSPVIWFGLINVGQNLLGLLAMYLVQRRLDAAGRRAVTWLLFASNAVLVAAMIGFGWSGHFELALASYWAVWLARHINEPLYTAWVNQQIDQPEVRATLISTASQANALGQIAGGPLVGLIGKWVSIQAALVVAGLILSPVLILYPLAARQKPPTPPLKGDHT